MSRPDLRIPAYPPLPASALSGAAQQPVSGGRVPRRDDGCRATAPAGTAPRSAPLKPAQLVLVRSIEPTSKLASLRVLEETAVAAVSYATVKRRLPVFAAQPWRQKLAAALRRARAVSTATVSRGLGLTGSLVHCGHCCAG